MNNNKVIDIDIANGINTPEVTNVFVPIGEGSHVDLEPYATKADTYTKAEVDDKVNGVHVDLSNYYNKGEVDSRAPQATQGNQALLDLLAKTELTVRKVNKEFLDHLDQKVNHLNIPILLRNN